MREEKYSKSGVNKNTYNLLFQDFENLSDEEMGTFKDFITFKTIDEFTKIKEKSIFQKILNFIYKDNYVKLDKITYNDKTKQYEYQTEDDIITFNKISNLINIEDKKFKQEILSKKRYGLCHSRSMMLSPWIENSKITTGYITIGTQKCLHSIVEYFNGEEIIILDWTRNLVMSKKDYNNITKFIELASYDGKEVLEDMKNLFSNINLPIKLYLTFREELKRDSIKNSTFFSNNKKIEESLSQINPINLESKKKR